MGFRDEAEALRARRDALRARLQERDDEATRLELASVRARIDEMRRLAAQNIVNRARGAFHCPTPWEGMVGDDTVRRCALCERNVYDFSGLTAIEAAGLLLEHEGHLCTQLWRRRDGTVLTKDCDVGRTRRRRQLAIVGAGLVVASAVGAAAVAPGSPSKRPPLRPTEPLPRVEIEAPMELDLRPDPFGYYVSIDRALDTPDGIRFDDASSRF